MSRKKQLVIILIATLTITSLVSHVAARALKIRTDAATPLSFGATNQPVEGVVAGSSLMFYGVGWAEVTRALGMRMQGWAVPSGSVIEMEVLQSQVTKARYTFLGVGASDLNENYVSDFRSEIVPLRAALRGLWEARSQWSFARTVVSQYPLSYLRKLFPTAGRSTTIMVGAREVLRSLRPTKQANEPSERAVVASENNGHQENITSWPEDRLLRNIGGQRASAGGTYSFNGPKRDALFRFMKRGDDLGKMIVLVMPLSPAYQKEFLTESVQLQFNAVLAEAAKKTPDALWIRLDAVPELNSNENFWDLVHLNAPGQALASKLVLEQLAAAGIR
jgi:hypothetical protein